MLHKTHNNKIIIVSTQRPYCTLRFIGALVVSWILGFLLKYMVNKLTITIDIKTYTYEIS